MLYLHTGVGQRSKVFLEVLEDDPWPGCLGCDLDDFPPPRLWGEDVKKGKCQAKQPGQSNHHWNEWFMMQKSPWKEGQAGN